MPEYWQNIRNATHSSVSRVSCIFLMILLLSAVFPTVSAGQPLYKDSTAAIGDRVTDLLHRMTLQEKIGQLSKPTDVKDEYKELVRQGLITGLYIAQPERSNEFQRIALEESRLGIPLLFATDVIHGFRTIFPIPLGLAATWNPGLVEECVGVAAMEAAANGVRQTYSPMVDVARDARWGRIAESAGEDPWLNTVMAQAYVRGYQGEDLSDPHSVLACVKHYVAYGAATAGRDYNTVDISERTLREIYLPPFKSAIDAGAGSIMSAFNDLNGVPATANPYTLKRILRDEWGFNGFVISDFDAIEQLIDHRVVDDTAAAAKEALLAGVDVDMGDVYQRILNRLVEDGEISTAAIDQAVRRVLRMKFALGLFENPYVNEESAEDRLLTEESLEVARQAARESIVLLKNTEDLLPLPEDLDTLAVIGPLADNRTDLLGTWWGEGRAKDVVSILEGIQAKVSDDTRVRYARGCGIRSDSTDGFSDALQAVRGADVAIVALGESREMNGEAGSRAILDLPGAQTELLKKIYRTGTPVVLVLSSGRPLAISWSAGHLPAILAVWAGGVQAGNGIADVLFGDYNPGGKLTATFPRTAGQEPLFYNHKNTGRPPSEEKFTSKYIDVHWSPLYPFGHGLSYTEFQYGNLSVVPMPEKKNQFTVSVDVTNTGQRAGDEVVQLYVSRTSASVSPPVKELKGFERIHLTPGETRRVSFTLEPYHLSYINTDMERVVEPGTFRAMAGGSSVNIISAEFTVESPQHVAEHPPVEYRVE